MKYNSFINALISVLIKRIKLGLNTCLGMVPFLLFVISAMPAQANISVNLSEPNWQFLLQNEPWAASEAQLKATERHFAREIQPLLAANNHAAIIQAFENRDIEDDSAALRLLRGQVLLSLKRYSEAESALQAALQSMPDLALAHRSISMVYMLQKKYKKARQHLTRSIELGVADAQIYGQLAFVNLQLQLAASAVAGYQHALFLESNNPQWQQGLLYALIQSQALDQAQALVDELLQQDPNNAALWLQRGQIALKQQRPQQAIASLEAALLLGVNDADNIAFTAQLHIQKGSPRRAVELLSAHSKSLVAAGKVAVLDQIAAWLVFQQDWSQLDQLLQAIARLDRKTKTKNSNTLPITIPARERSRFALYQAQLLLAKNVLAEKADHQHAEGKKSARNKNQKRARKALKQAIELDPTNGEALLTFAQFLRQQNHNEQADIYYTRAQALPEFKERALLGRSQLAIDGQHYSQALGLLRQVIQHNPNRTDVLANIQALENVARSKG